MPPVDDRAALRALLYERLRLRPEPLLSGEDFAVPAASIWAGGRAWVERLRRLGLRAGDRVVLALPGGAAHAMATVACWWEGLTLCPVAPSEDPAVVASDLDARIVIHADDHDCTLRPTPAGGPDERSTPTPRAAGAPTAGAALIMSTSGTQGLPKRVVMSDGNLLHQVSTHAAGLGHGPGVRCAAVVPWHHAFGLLVNVWPALLGGSSVHIDPDGGRDPQRLLAVMRSRGIDRVGLVPLQARWLIEAASGPGAIAGLGGVIGGAPVDAQLATMLSQTRFRAGYGQTEASPGVTLGEPGVWRAGWLGSPVGCETRVDNGELLVRGPNVTAGVWQDGVFRRLDPRRWLRTGDLVREVHGGLVFLGRVDERFKLANGRMVDAPYLERSIAAATGAREVVVCPCGASGVTVALIGGRVAGVPGTTGLEACVARAMRGQGSMLQGVHVLEAGAVPRTKKGAVDRVGVAGVLSRRGSTVLAAA